MAFIPKNWVVRYCPFSAYQLSCLIRTWSGLVYVAFITDAYSRMIVGWRVAAHMRTTMVLDAIEQKRLKLKSGELVDWVPGDQIHAVSDRLKEYFNSPEFEEADLNEKYRLLKEGLHIAREPKRLRKKSRLKKAAS